VEVYRKMVDSTDKLIPAPIILIWDKIVIFTAHDFSKWSSFIFILSFDSYFHGTWFLKVIFIYLYTIFQSLLQMLYSFLEIIITPIVLSKTISLEVIPCLSTTLGVNRVAVLSSLSSNFIPSHGGSKWFFKISTILFDPFVFFYQRIHYFWLNTKIFWFINYQIEGSGW